MKTNRVEWEMRRALKIERINSIIYNSMENRNSNHKPLILYCDNKNEPFLFYSNDRISKVLAKMHLCAMWKPISKYSLTFTDNITKVLPLTSTLEDLNIIPETHLSGITFFLYTSDYFICS